jgi:uncharacterized protein (DUF1786 family)
MGGGPCYWALDRHMKAGLNAYSTPDAAKTFNDHLEEVEQWGVTIVSEDEARTLSNADRVEMKDLDLDRLNRALSAYGMEPGYDGIAVAVLDHGAAPKDVSDRLFRFQHLQRTVEAANDLRSFIYLEDEEPDYLTRMKAVAKTAPNDVPLLLLDTGPAAAMGAQDDRQVAHHEDHYLINLGNMHTLAFHLRGYSIMGLFEHHTDFMTVEKLDDMTQRLAKGTLSNEEVFESEGHGCHIIEGDGSPDFLAVTGPRRNLMANSALNPNFAAPHGDMMLTGCFGLVRAFAERADDWREEILAALDR